MVAGNLSFARQFRELVRYFTYLNLKVNVMGWWRLKERGGKEGRGGRRRRRRGGCSRRQRMERCKSFSITAKIEEKKFSEEGSFRKDAENFLTCDKPFQAFRSSLINALVELSFLI